MDSTGEPLHVIFLPYMAPGHMMPMVDIARLFAAHGVHVTIITTKMNALRFKATIDRDVAAAGRHITLEILPFPSAEAGLPEGCENLADTPSHEMAMRLFHTIDLLQPPIEKLLRDSRPDCIVSDSFFHWTVDIALELGIPRIFFSSGGFFHHSIRYAVEHYQLHKNIHFEREPFVIPSLPDQVLITKSQLLFMGKTTTTFLELFGRVKEAEKKSYGMVANSFHALESAYADYYRKAIGIKGWHVGPVSLFNKDEVDKAERGDKATINRESCLHWLNFKEPNSVLYVCFGSLSQFSKIQLTEMAHAFEDTNCSFIWVVPKVLKTNEEVDQDEAWWLPEGFKERMEESGKGLILMGWAPQVLILEHRAIGGFLTHCGWNSIVEGVTAGLPLVTWPLFGDQFDNEKLVTQVLRIGVPVGNEEWKMCPTDETSLISRVKIHKAVSHVMDGGNEAEGMRSIVKRLGELAKEAIEDGGSSYNDLKTLMEDIKLYRQK
ncbi:UDP-glucose flavonoid 3-O-glucosyltransferase [Actinidia chinensis var. chinensis]|uniref:Glycosyltransferase n=1 Tax=Actinidia chinensis var. chinensis TaxID=1590841 RepID=A0A2R6RN32_ACTCC|nr:UDP-glucose flavonoid 3-O-glucosyltransferase [Actinidia chinensis var. chinensis]PSS31449.1 UDP-glucose flavonoid 3-O-glucosyltransferase [Actinidia chinensis var. chinensis]